MSNALDCHPPRRHFARAALVLLAPLFALAAVHAQPTASGDVIVGAVRAADGVPIAGAHVRLISATVAEVARAPAAVLTGDDGVFRFAGVGRGSVAVAIRRLGFRAETLSVEVPMLPGGPIVVLLEPVPLSLSPVVVRARQAEATGPFREFLERKARGFGYFITRRDIEERRPARVTDLFRSVPNLQLDRDEGMPIVRMRGRRCEPLVWMDRVPLVGGFPDLDALPPKSIEGVEVYSGVSSIPPDLIGPRDAGACGVIVVWTRHGERPGAAREFPAPSPDFLPPVDAHQVFTADQVDSMAAPMPTVPFAPPYPDSLRALGIPGRVLVEFVVDTLGSVEDGSVGIVSATHPSFGGAVRGALRGIRFVPAVRGGRPVRQLVLLPVRFSVDGARPPTP